MGPGCWKKDHLVQQESVPFSKRKWLHKNGWFFNGTCKSIRHTIILWECDGNVNQYNHYNQQNQDRCLLGCFFGEVGVRLCPLQSYPPKNCQAKFYGLIEKIKQVGVNTTFLWPHFWWGVAVVGGAVVKIHNGFMFGLSRRCFPLLSHHDTVTHRRKTILAHRFLVWKGCQLASLNFIESNSLSILIPQNWLFWGPYPCYTGSIPSIGGSQLILRAYTFIEVHWPDNLVLLT